LDHADGCYEFGMADLVIDLVDPRISEKKEDPFLVHFENLRYNSVIPGRSLLQVYHPSVFKYAWQNKSRRGPNSVRLLSKIGSISWRLAQTLNLNLERIGQDRFFYNPKKTRPSEKEVKKMIPVRNR